MTKGKATEPMMSSSIRNSSKKSKRRYKIIKKPLKPQRNLQWGTEKGDIGSLLFT